MQKKLGNGADTYFWEDLWHGDMVLKQRYPRLYALEVKKTVDVASKLSHENLTWSFRRAPRSGVEQDQLTDLTTYVEGVVLGVTPDRWYWTFDGSGMFKTNTLAKSIQDALYNDAAISNPHKWNSWIPRKVNIYVWRAAFDRLPTRTNLFRRGVSLPSTTCPICDIVEEDIDHMFSIGDLASGSIFSQAALVNADQSEVVRILDEDLFPAIQRISKVWILARLKANDVN
ncbi:RNA-directed DNA polymerase, eukaryota, reverse transcriptase zinc-binding domain protein [Tanacetum coccineum]